MASATLVKQKVHRAEDKTKSKTKAAIEFAQQAERLGQYAPGQENEATGSTQAVEARFVTAQDPVIQTADGGRLPAVPIDEATKLNKLRDIVDHRDPSQNEPVKAEARESKDGTIHGVRPEKPHSRESGKADAPLGAQHPPSRTNPLFPPMPIRVAERAWKQGKKGEFIASVMDGEEGNPANDFIPLEGGPDTIPCDIRYYARRVGLDCEVFEVQTEDGFIIELWHLYTPREYRRAKPSERTPHAPDVFPDNGSTDGVAGSQYTPGEKKYPVLMIHGLLQSAGAYCTNDDDSLAFFLAKSGYDVWLGNNRCGFNPRHTMLKYSDPRMWAWNIRQMGVMDLPALISRVLTETGFPKLGLIAHSQGTTQSLVALAKEQRPEIGEKISVFCALAPAAYAGPLIGKMYFKFMRVISPGMFRAIFGIHAFIPFMMTMHSMLPPRFYGAMGYRVFSFLFNWTDDRWERDLRDRMFQFAPVYVSAESMRWWLGRECFAKQKCILATREEKSIEDREDEQEDQQLARSSESSDSDEDNELGDSQPGPNALSNNASGGLQRRDSNRARFAWYGPRTPPFALWVCGADDLVDGRRLLRRFERNREPFVDVVHSKIIEGYEHLDVIWAMDAIEKVGKEVREVIWKTAPKEARRVCRTPRGCGEIKEHEFYKRMADERECATREVDVTAGEWSEKGKEQVGGGAGEGNRDLEGEIREVEERVL
ncbi:alpha/beta-hydrolase [Trematosphaeria pertusa]|uniref:Alpha/beta-hydrolase n=1 Tax=Trematosphaeria pertusa TaxID=390896 RepID=A0A6A6IRN1_9PLEO|nr:alpha/beta-hydrolase [Trematosphaeria pertusa]KAF2252969.1 alpha/beta-hydrolase [Trematosphaeria pertusa]